MPGKKRERHNPNEGVGQKRNIGDIDRSQPGIVQQDDPKKAFEHFKALYHVLFDNANDAVFLMDFDTFVECNPMALKMFGCTREQIIGTTPYGPFSPEFQADGSRSKEKAREKLKLVMNGNSQSFDWSHLRYDGSHIETQVSLNPIRLNGNTYVQAIVRDVTNHKRAEDKMRENKERLVKAFQASPNLMGIVDFDENRRIFVNDAFTRITGYSQKDVTGTTFEELNFWVESERLYEMLQHVKNNRVLQDYEVDIRTNQGHIRTLRYHAVLLDIPGKNVGMFSAEDITEQRKAKRKIREYQLKLKSLASELSLAEERERRRIAAGIHDDMAQKLVMAKFGLESLGESIEDETIASSLEGPCHLLDGIIENARKLVFDLSNAALYQVGLEAAVASWLKHDIQDKYSLSCELIKGMSPLRLDDETKITFFRAIKELLANVVKYADANHVTVRIQKSDDIVRVSVEDDGVGFDVSGLDTSMTPSGGFGLFNIQERLEYLGGRLEIDSGPGEGTCVTMVAPYRQGVTVG